MEALAIPFTSESASWHAGIFAIINGNALIANIPLIYWFHGSHDRMVLSCSYGLWLEVAACNLARSGNHSLEWGVNALLYGFFINTVMSSYTLPIPKTTKSFQRFQPNECNIDLALWTHSKATMRFSYNMLCIPRTIFHIVVTSWKGWYFC